MRTGSWVIQRRSDNAALLEIFDKTRADEINATSEVLKATPISVYLAELNKRIAENGGIMPA